jgi:hypothetical protein
MTAKESLVRSLSFIDLALSLRKAWLTKPGSKETKIVKRRLQLASLPYLGEIDSVHLKLEGVALWTKG